MPSPPALNEIIAPGRSVLLSKHLRAIAVSALIVGGLGLRLLGIDFGLPYVFFSDEAVLVNHAVAFGTGDLNPHYFTYPSLLMYVLFALYGLIYVVGLVLGTFTSTDDFARLFFNDVSVFYLSGRLLAAISGSITIVVVYSVARRMFNERTALIASAMLAFNVMHVEYSHYVKTHVPAALLTSLGLYVAWSIYQRPPSWRRYILGGLLAGLAASTIYHAAFILFSIVSAHYLRPHSAALSDDQSLYTRASRLLNPMLLASLIASGVGFFIGTPFALLDWPTFSRELTTVGQLFYEGGFWEWGLFYPFRSLRETMGEPLGTLALLSLCYALIRRHPAQVVLAVQPLAVGLFLMLFRTKESHLMLVAFPALSILIASSLHDCVGAMAASRKSQSIVLSAIVLVVLINPARLAYLASYRLSLPDTRTVAKIWVEDNLPSGATIVMDTGKYYLGTFGPPLQLSAWTLEQFIQRGEELSPEDITTHADGMRRAGYSREAEYFRQQLRLTTEDGGYDIVQILHDPTSFKAEVRTLDEYLASGVEYAIVSSYSWQRYVVGGPVAALHPQKAQKYRALYEALVERATLVKEFLPSKARVGPALRIYRLN